MDGPAWGFFRSQSATYLWISPIPIGWPDHRKTHASSHNPDSCGQHLAVTPISAFVSLMRSCAVLKSPLATASFIPLTSSSTGQASMQTGVPHKRHLSASRITSSSVYGSWTSEKLVVRLAGSALRNGKPPTRSGLTFNDYKMCKTTIIWCLAKCRNSLCRCVHQVRGCSNKKSDVLKLFSHFYSMSCLAYAKPRSFAYWYSSEALHLVTASMAIVLFHLGEFRVRKVVQPRDVPRAADVAVWSVARRMIGKHVELAS